jgi:carboxymethylenebutenolidase
MTSPAADSTIEILTDDGSIPTHFFGSAHPGPVIVVVQEIFGVSPYIRSRAADLAALGYQVLVPEIYWRLGEVTIDESSDGVLEQAMATVARLDWERAVADAAAVVAYARELPGSTTHVGLVGFCFGVGLAFNTAAIERVDALVCYYGSALPDLLGLAPQVAVPSLHHFGDADDYLPLEVVERIRTALSGNPALELHLYPGANHAFDGPVPDLHHEAASQLAWSRTVEFLGRVLPTA